MIRLTLLWMFIAGLGIYAFRDWYKSLCGLIILMAVMGHADMPKTVWGIQGFNAWNLLFIFVMLGWFSSRKSEGLRWDMPLHVNILLLIYLAAILIGFARMIIDQETLIEFALISGAKFIPNTSSLISEHLINSLKWIIPGLLLFHGCNSHSRFKLAVFSVLGIYFLLAIQIIKWMPLDVIGGGESMSDRAAKILQNELGENRDTLSTMLSGAFWAILAATSLLKRKSYTVIFTLAGFATFFAQALTGGRAGYISWAGVGLTLGFFRWRKYVLLIPLLVAIILLVIPGVSERITKGFTDETVQYMSHLESSPYFDGSPNDYALYTITSGRSFAWPYIIDEILQSPLVGYGLRAMQRTGLSIYLLQNFQESFPHPHSAYLQLLLDSGLVGFILVMIFYIVVIKYSISLLRDTRSPVFVTIGGVTLSIVGAQLIGSFGSHSFYPDETAVGIWCAIGLMFRVFVERSRIVSSNKNIVSQDMDQLLWERKGVKRQ